MATVTYLGSVTVAAFVGPLAAQIAALVAAIENCFVIIRAQLDLIAGFKLTIRALALADLEAQLSAALSIQAQLSLSISDPTIYIRGLLAAIIQVQANLTALIPSFALQAQLSASISIAVELSAKIAAFDLALSVILSISASISAALQIAFPVLPNAPGVYVFTYSGRLGDMGAALDAAIGPDAGLSANDTVFCPIVVVDAGNAAAITGLRAVVLAA